MADDNVIRIEDLTDPVLTPEQQVAVDYGATLEVSLVVEDLLEEARERTGLADFGSDGFRPRLRAHVEAVGLMVEGGAAQAGDEGLVGGVADTAIRADGSRDRALEG